MCNHIYNAHFCNITKEQCPYMYYCSKVSNWRENTQTPKQCKVAMKAETPKGYCRVALARHGYLYVDFGNVNIKVLNPFGDETPQFVKVRKLKNGTYKISK